MAILSEKQLEKLRNTLFCGEHQSIIKNLLDTQRSIQIERDNLTKKLDKLIDMIDDCILPDVDCNGGLGCKDCIKLYLEMEETDEC